MRGILNVIALVGLALLLLSWSIILYPNFWSALRSHGAPVPYCTTNNLAIGCEYKAPASYSQIHSITTSDPVIVTITGFEPVDFLNTLCNHAKSGGNVLAIVNNTTKESNAVATSLYSCGVKVRRYYEPYTIAVSPAALLIISPDFSLYTDCNAAVSYELKHLKSRWEHA